MDETLDFLIPSFDQLSEEALQQALPDITDAKLRKAMLADQELQGDLIASILMRKGLGPHVVAPLGEVRAYLETVAKMPAPDLCLYLGAAAAAQSLAQALLTGLKDTDIPRDVLKASLRFREQSQGFVQPDGVPTRLVLEKDGRGTLNAWLTTLPRPAESLIRLRFEQEVAPLPCGEVEKRKALCEAVLAHLSAAEATT